MMTDPLRTEINERMAELHTHHYSPLADLREWVFLMRCRWMMYREGML